MKITVQCVGCKNKKVLTGNQIPKGDTPPMCEVCYMPMVAVKVGGKPK